MTSAYRRDHILTLRNDEFERLPASARATVVSQSNALEALYPTPAATAAELTALRRAMARFLIDSGKISLSGAF